MVGIDRHPSRTNHPILTYTTNIPTSQQRHGLPDEREYCLPRRGRIDGEILRFRRVQGKGVLVLVFCVCICMQPPDGKTGPTGHACHDSMALTCLLTYTHVAKHPPATQNPKQQKAEETAQTRQYLAQALNMSSDLQDMSHIYDRYILATQYGDNPSGGE